MPEASQSAEDLIRAFWFVQSGEGLIIISLLVWRKRRNIVRLAYDAWHLVLARVRK